MDDTADTSSSLEQRHARLRDLLDRYERGEIDADHVLAYVTEHHPARVESVKALLTLEAKLTRAPGTLTDSQHSAYIHDADVDRHRPDNP